MYIRNSLAVLSQSHCVAEAAAEVLLANKAKLICLAQVNSRRELVGCLAGREISIEKGQLPPFTGNLGMRVMINKFWALITISYSKVNSCFFCTIYSNFCMNYGCKNDKNLL